ncbi:small RNA 2'-O-methyltransferase-like [Actinia tenebrosa]|uniref:Small RNA 2'-O-methyltransferase n=1 Tax=Actinia tenebrosa TaxID=6105 RepID=A0A6P8IAV1_ACTTE|nr:small RNA 2'-O-methyltransferase-like [Actinia tenebrosa]XP_031561840.1 small RNA 2'-O-methyltransferase-like [Actinia tenebrosa]XP_031561841.1 small RNA 2'-O-methyltransferase-like [Actinia tenebrosa]
MSNLPDHGSGQKDLGENQEIEESKESHSEHEPPGISFDPPVYRQRYGIVFQMVQKYNAKKVLDFGCAECKLLRFLISNEAKIEHLVGVDIDGDLLQQSKFRIEPLIYDYLHPKEVPFTVTTLQGSISQADDRFCNFDLISCVEIIEHLVPEHLEAMPKVLFGQLSPKVAIVTTPNADFNVLFPNLEGFRHWDHKFEWTREEFEEWATIQANKYGYTVSFQGIGNGPIGTEHLGCCSQMALFEKNDSICIPKEEQSFGQPYQLIKEVEYPYRKCTITEEQKILYEVERLLWLLSQPNEYEEEEDEPIVDDDSPKSFELKRLLEMRGLQKLCGTMEKLKSVLESSRFKLTEDGDSIIWCRPMWESDESEDSLDWNIDDDEDNKINPLNISPTEHNINEPTENWDSDLDDSDTKIVHYTSDVCWNTVGNNDTCQYWDGTKDIESENTLTGDKDAENDYDDDNDEDFCHFRLSWQGAKIDDGDDHNEEVCNLDDDGLIWIASEETTSKIANTLSNST